MRTKYFSLYVSIGCIAAYVLQNDLLATTTDNHFGAQAISDQATAIQNFLFGAPMRLAGVLGGAYGVLQAVLTSTMKPLIVYGGIGVAVNVVPKFIDGVFSLLIP